MAQPYIGEIRMFGGNFAPAGWMFCDGQLLDISTNDVLFSVIGTTYGGDGQSTFALPDLRGRLPVHFGNGRTLGENGGVEEVTLTTQQIPAHTHPAGCDNNTNAGNSPTPGGHIWANQASTGVYATAFNPAVNMNPAAGGSTGGSQPHENMMPFLCVSFIISLFGIFPSQT
jgi:microcystin-dependent protein